MFTHTRILYIIRVGEQFRPLAVRPFALQQTEISVRLPWLIAPLIEQPEVIVDVVHLFIVRIRAVQAEQLALAEVKHVELVLENDAAVMQSVHDDEVTGLHLLFVERYLCEIILPFVRIVLRAVCYLLQRILHGSGFGQRVAHLIGKFLRTHRLRDNSLIGALPVVDVLAFAPQFLESLLTLSNSHRIIEVPCTLFCLLRRLGLLLVVGVLAPVTALFLLHALLSLSLLLPSAFLLLFLLQLFYHAVDGCIALAFGQFGQPLQRILQMDGICEGHQLVEHFRTPRQLLVVGPLFVEQSDGFAVATLRVVELLHGPIEVSELQQQHTFLHSAARSFLVSVLVCRDGVRCILLGKVDVTDGIVDLIEVILVFLRTSQALQL